MRRRLHVGVFDDERAFLEAAGACQRLGVDVVDAYTPYPMHEVEHLLGLRRTRLPWVTLVGGLVGLGLGLWFQYWTTSGDWPVNVGGKPWDSLPAFVPVAFELTILLAGIATVVGLLLRSRLRPGKSPRRAVPGVTDDRFALVVARRSDRPTWTEPGRVLLDHGAVRHWEEEA